MNHLDVSPRSQAGGEEAYVKVASWLAVRGVWEGWFADFSAGCMIFVSTWMA